MLPNYLLVFTSLNMAFLGNFWAILSAYKQTTKITDASQNQSGLKILQEICKNSELKRDSSRQNGRRGRREILSEMERLYFQSIIGI